MHTILNSTPVLGMLNPNQDFILWTDVSDMAIGAILSQKQDWKEKIVERPLGFYSRKLHDIETRYPAYDTEL
jgi:hypothetical protein